MRKLKKALCLLLCICFVFSALLSSVIKSFALSGPALKVDSVVALPSDSIEVNLTLTENPGTMAMSFGISYNTDILSFKSWKKGFLTDYTVNDFKDLGQINFVNCEPRNITKTGIILKLCFDVKENAPKGFYEIKIVNIRQDVYGDSLEGCFANWQGDKLEPIITNGGVTITDDCSVMGHSYGDWIIRTAADCTTDGERYKLCSKCSDEIKETIPAAHSYKEIYSIYSDCEKEGYIIYRCNACEDVKHEVIPAIGHKNMFSHSIKESYTQPTKNVYKCEICGKEAFASFGYALCDFNRDGLISEADTARLSQMISSGEYNYSEEFDFDNDGKTQSFDLTILKLLINGLDFNEMIDINSDGKSDLLDFVKVKKSISENAECDINQDGCTDANDMVFTSKFLIFLTEKYI